MRRRCRSTGTSEQVNVLGGADALAHEAQHVRAQRLDARLQGSDAGLRHQLQLLTAQVGLHLVEELVVRLALDEHGKQALQVPRVENVVNGLEQEAPVLARLLGELVEDAPR